mmetsp:Transcript_12443/g.18641  ORF Transcript_12443/g.18641 Transcript_12443/m.18641 type:complete len:163 (+) Transcript_12443:846-1334(+)
MSSAAERIVGVDVVGLYEGSLVEGDIVVTLREGWRVRGAEDDDFTVGIREVEGLLLTTLQGLMLIDGDDDGIFEGLEEGFIDEGMVEGLRVGMTVGLNFVGCSEGHLVAIMDGILLVGLSDGEIEGKKDDLVVGVLDVGRKLVGLNEVGKVLVGAELIFDRA